MQEKTSAKPGKTLGVSSPQPQRQHISDSQFRFSYDIPNKLRRNLCVENRPLTVPVWSQVGDLSQPTRPKRSHARRPDGNPVTGEGYEPRHYRPSYYGPLKAYGDVEKLPVKEKLSPRSGGERAQDDSSPLALNSAPPLRQIAQRPASALGRKRVPPGGYSDGLW